MYEVRSYTTAETSEGYADMIECLTKKDAVRRAKEALTTVFQEVNEIPVRLVTIVKSGTDDLLEEFHNTESATIAKATGK